MNDKTVYSILLNYEKSLMPYGFEVKPFLIGWYNDKLNENFHLNFSYNTLAINIINSPIMFEKTFLDYIVKSEIAHLETSQDLLDQSIDSVLNRIDQEISSNFTRTHNESLKTIIIRDCAMNNVTRQPKVVVTTAGHVSGQVRYYQKMDVPLDVVPWGKDEKIFGCSLHHIYGGWFAFRGIIIFPDIELPSLIYSDPPDPLKNNIDLIICLLNEFNFNWKSWKFRDVIDVDNRYSRAFMTYFSLPPGEQRWALVLRWREILMNHHGDDVSSDVIDDVMIGETVLDWGMA